MTAARAMVAADALVRPMKGERVSGDATVVRIEGERALVAVIDALGHGPKAEAVANVAVAYLSAVALTMDVGALMTGLDEKLRGGRGAAAMLCLFEGARMAGCGVGNVEMFAVGAKLPVTLTPGIVGMRMHRLRLFDATLPLGTRLVVYSDGIASAVNGSDARKMTRVEACRMVMERYGKSHDDATVLVADVVEA